MTRPGSIARVGLAAPAAFGAAWAAIPIAWRGAPESVPVGGALVAASLLCAAAAGVAATAALGARLRARIGDGADGAGAIRAFPRDAAAATTAVELLAAFGLLAAGSAAAGEGPAEWPGAYGLAVGFSSLAMALPRLRWARARAHALAEAAGAAIPAPPAASRRPLREALLGWAGLASAVVALPLGAATARALGGGIGAGGAAALQVIAAAALALWASAAIAAGARRRIAVRAAQVDAVPGSVEAAGEAPFVAECAALSDAIGGLSRRYEEMCEAQGKRIETRAQTREKKARVFASMSHDLRGPLNSIVGFGDLLLKGIDGPLAERQRATVEEISRQSERLLALVGDVLDTAKMDAGRFEIEAEPTSCAEILRACEERVGRSFASRGLSFGTELEPGMPPLVVDRERVAGVLAGLAARAADAMSGGGLVLGARRASSLEEGRDYALFEIRDEGGAVSTGWREHVLDVSASLEGVIIGGEDGGLALGLSLVQRILGLHGGELDVGASGARAVFSVALPLDRGADGG